MCERCRPQRAELKTETEQTAQTMRVVPKQGEGQTQAQEQCDCGCTGSGCTCGCGCC